MRRLIEQSVGRTVAVGAVAVGAAAVGAVAGGRAPNRRVESSSSHSSAAMLDLFVEERLVKRKGQCCLKLILECEFFLA